MGVLADFTTTTAILESLRARHDDGAWSMLVERYEPVIRAIARSFDLNEEDARDVSQQVLLECVRDLRQGRYQRGRGRLRQWMMGIARHRAIDARRQLRLRSALPISEDAPDDAALERTWEEAYRRTLLGSALRRLREESQASPATLAAFELVAVRGLSSEAAAQATGLSVEQVYVAKHRMATRLRAIATELETAWSEESG